MNKDDIDELLDLVSKYNGEAKNSNESDTLDELIESNKKMKSDLKELIHDNSRYIKTNSELATENEQMKNDLKDINKLMDIAFNDDIKSVTEDYEPLYDDEETNKAHRIAVKYRGK